MWPRISLLALTQETPIVPGDRVLGILASFRVVDLIKGEIGPRPLGFTEVEVLFHAFVADSIVFIVVVVETMWCFGVSLNTLIGY